MMRDSLGNAAPLSITAFEADGQPLAGEPVTLRSSSTRR